MNNFTTFLPIIIFISLMLLMFYFLIGRNLKYLPKVKRIKELQREFSSEVTDETVTELISLLKELPRISNEPSNWESMRACYYLVYESDVNPNLIQELRKVMMGLGVNRLKP